MTLEQAIRSVLGQYTNFSGRARRSEYWLWTLAVVGASLVALLASAASNALGGLLQLALFAIVVVPGLAVLVRRLHDTDRPAWWLLLFLVPFGVLVGQCFQQSFDLRRVFVKGDKVGYPHKV